MVEAAETAGAEGLAAEDYQRTSSPRNLGRATSLKMNELVTFVTDVRQQGTDEVPHVSSLLPDLPSQHHSRFASLSPITVPLFFSLPPSIFSGPNSFVNFTKIISAYLSALRAMKILWAFLSYRPPSLDHVSLCYPPPQTNLFLPLSALISSLASDPHINRPKTAALIPATPCDVPPPVTLLVSVPLHQTNWCQIFSFLSPEGLAGPASRTSISRLLSLLSPPFLFHRLCRSCSSLSSAQATRPKAQLAGWKAELASAQGRR